MTTKMQYLISQAGEWVADHWIFLNMHMDIMTSRAVQKILEKYPESACNTEIMWDQIKSHAESIIGRLYCGNGAN